jgi:hypothetical protein
VQSYELSEREQVVYDFLLENDVSLNEVLDVVIKSNGLVGVGLISLLNEMDAHIGRYTS